MKATKRISAIFLALVLALSLLPVSVFAAGSDYSTRLLVDKVADDKVDVKWMVQTSNGAVMKTANSIIFKYDHTKYDMLTNDGEVITTKTMSDNLCGEYVTSEYAQRVTVFDSPALWDNSGIYAEAKGNWTFVLINLLCSKPALKKEYTTETALAVIHLKLKSGAVDDGLPGGSIALADTTEAKNCAQSGIVLFIGTGEEKFIYGRTDGSGDTLLTTPVVAPGTGVTFAKPPYSGDIAAPTVNSNAGGTVVLNNAVLNPADSTANIKYGYSNSASTAPTTWQDSTTFDSLTPGDTLYFYAKVVETPEYTEKVSAASTAVTVADKALSSISIAGGATANVPTKAQGKTTVNLTATGTYNDASTGSITNDANWTVDPAHPGVSVSKGVVTIAPEAAAGSVTIKAEKDGQSKTHSITLSKASAELKSMTISGADGVAVPPAASSPKVENYAVSGEDQFGAPCAPTAVAWSIEGTPTGVSIGTSDGKLSVESNAATGSVTIKAVSGSIFATKTVSITKAASAVDTVTIGGGVSSLTVPAMDTLGTVKKVDATAAFTATLKDQYGADISGTVTWSVSGNSGVTIDSASGLLTISSSATDAPVTVTATAENGKTGTAAVTITKAPSAATFVQVKKGGTVVTTDTIIIPTSGSAATTVTYTAEVYDQYGTKMTSESVNWSIEAGATGATQSSGVVTVPSTATADTVKLTAASSSDSSKKAEVTITLSNKPIHNIDTFADAAKTITYGDHITSQTVTCSTGGTVQYESSDETIVSVDASTGALTVRKVGTVTITAKVAEDPTHAAASTSYTVTVGQKQLEITDLTATDRKYDTTVDVALTGGRLSGKVDSDDVDAVIPTTGAMADAKVGDNKPVTVTTPSLTGTDAGNYTLKPISGITVNIAQATPDVGDVSYTGTGTIYTSTDVSTITLSMNGSAAASGAPDAGTLALNGGQTLTVGANNYNWTFTPSDPTNYKTVTGKVSLTVTGDALSGIAASGTLSKNTYKWGEPFEITGVTITATYASGTTKDVTSEVEFSTTLAVNQTKVEVTYQGEKCDITGFTVKKADALTSLPAITVTQRHTVTAEQSKDIGRAGMPENAGNLTYAKGSESSTGSATIAFAVDGSTVKFTITGGAVGEVITLPVTIGSDNYEPSTVNVKVTLTDKDIPTVTANDITVTYDGNPIPVSKITGTATFGGTPVPGTWAWKAGMAVTNVAESGNKTVVFKPTDSANYAEVEKTINVTINKATPAGTPTYTAITTSGKTLANANLTVGTITPAGTIRWNAGDTQSVAANTAYDWTFEPTDTVNYNNLTGSITPYVVSYSGGGGGSYTPSYSITVDKTENGTITVSPKSASKGDTVTVTVKPDKGYELDTLKVLDKNGDALKLTEKNGKYTFTMPAGKVTVKGSFVEETPVQIFKDVPVDAYYYEAVKWAAEKGITGGVGNGLFAPNQPCTRAQIVTFLWRAAGSPAPKNPSTSFGDVKPGSFYEQAVAWAVENGITGGTGDGKFSPDATCTRAQAVTFLYRAAGSPKVSGSAEFGDVATNAYYADAVAWAAKNGITGGIGGGLFGSGNDCTRAQIVTFLYRSVK